MGENLHNVPAALLLDVPSGNRLYNTDGDEIGSLSHVVLDLNNGCALYAVVSTGAVLGMGGRLSPIPWQMLQMGPEENHFILNVDPEKLKLGPAFDRKDWQQTINEDWLNSLFTYYGYRRSGGVGAAMNREMEPQAGPDVYPRSAEGPEDAGPTRTTR